MRPVCELVLVVARRQHELKNKDKENSSYFERTAFVVCRLDYILCRFSLDSPEGTLRAPLGYVCLTCLLFNRFLGNFKHYFKVVISKRVELLRLSTQRFEFCAATNYAS